MKSSIHRKCNFKPCRFNPQIKGKIHRLQIQDAKKFIPYSRDYKTLLIFFHFWKYLILLHWISQFKREAPRLVTRAYFSNDRIHRPKSPKACLIIFSLWWRFVGKFLPKIPQNKHLMQIYNIYIRQFAITSLVNHKSYLSKTLWRIKWNLIARGGASPKSQSTPESKILQKFTP